MFCFSELYVAFICRSGGAAALVLVRLGMGLAPVVLVTLPLVACDTTDERGGSRREIAARHDAADVLGISAGFRPSRRFSLSGLYSVACVVSLASRNRLGAARELLDFAKANR